MAPIKVTGSIWVATALWSHSAGVGRRIAKFRAGAVSGNGSRNRAFTPSRFPCPTSAWLNEVINHWRWCMAGRAVGKEVTNKQLWGKRQSFVSRWHTADKPWWRAGAFSALMVCRQTSLGQYFPNLGRISFFPLPGGLPLRQMVQTKNSGSRRFLMVFEQTDVFPPLSDCG